MMAAGRGQDRVARILLKHGAKPNAVDEDGRTPLIHAADAVNADKVIAVLLEAGADPGIKDKQGRTALSIASKSN